MIRNSLLLLLLCIFSVGMQAQKTIVKVNQLLQKAKDSIAVGNTDAGMKFLEQAEKLAPDNSAIQFEKAYVMYVAEAYKQSITLLQKLLETSEVKEDYYLLLGTNYDMMHQPDSAIIAYKKGLDAFPESGRLYYESGIVEFQQQQYHKAISFWETGVKTEPTYAGNYYMLTKLFNLTSEKIWVLCYGEIFMNLEPDTERTAEVSQLLFHVYSDSYHRQQTGNKRFFISQISNKESFEQAYTFVLNLAAQEVNASMPLTIKDIQAIRKQFLLQWYSEHKLYVDTYPNALIAYQKELIAKGCFESYTYWVFSEGNYQEFEIWLQQHQNKYDQLTEFVKTKSFTIAKTKLYARPDYNK